MNLSGKARFSAQERAFGFRSNVSLDRSQCFYLPRDSDYVTLSGPTLESDVVAEALGTYNLAKVRA